MGATRQSKTVVQAKLLVADSNVPPVRKKTQRKANELDGKRWLQYSISVWNDIRKTPDEKKRAHPAMFPVQLVTRLLEAFTTNSDEVVLDPFVGSGTTLVAARELDKRGIGFDVSSLYVAAAKQRLFGQIDSFKAHDADQIVIHDDARRMHSHLKKDSVDICITSPPYWDILTQKRSADGKEIRDYHAEGDNLGHLRSYQRFLSGLREVFEQTFVVLRPGKFCIVNVMDLRKKDKFYPFHMDLSREMIEIGYELDDIVIWDRRSEYNELRPLGYPAVFRINRIHEYVLIFRKPKKNDH